MIIKTDMSRTYDVDGVIDYTPELLDELKSDPEVATWAMNDSLLEVDKVLDVKWIDTIYSSDLKHNPRVELGEYQILMIIQIDFIDEDGDEFTRLIGAIADDDEQECLDLSGEL